MANKISKNEIISDEQLEIVSGGNDDQTKVDYTFFRKLGYSFPATAGELYPSTYGNTLESVFNENGVFFSGIGYFNNHYRINGSLHPHWAALGYVLSTRNYPGFTGNWTDSKYVHSFLKEHFGINDLG